MAAKKILVVFGATGNQGGSVVKAILGDSKMREDWTVRGVTRDVSKPSAKKLESLGAETVAADINDPATLKNAVKGAYAVFAVTNFWDSKSADVEFKQGKDMVDAAKEAGVQHYIWSTLLNVTKLSNGVLSGVTHFDSKAIVADYVRTTGIPASFFLPGFFMSNLPGGMFRPGPAGDYQLSLPVPGDAIVPLLDTGDDTGKFIKGILLHREQTLGKQILGATYYKTLNELVEEFKELYPEAGKTAKFVQLSHEVYKSNLINYAHFDDVSAEDLLQNMRLLSEFGYYGKEPLDESHSILVDKLTTWKEFMQKSPAFAELK